MINLTPKIKRNLKKIIPFGLLWFVFSLVYLLVEKGLLGNVSSYPSTGNPYNFIDALKVTPLSALITGLILGAVETIYLNNLFNKRSFGVKILFKTILYISSIIVFLITISIIGNSLRMDLPLFDPKVFPSILKFFSNFAFWSIVIYVGAMISISLFISDVIDNIGMEAMKNFFIGKYHAPIQEERIFMFLDMNDSTAIAEKLGHLKYFKLLNQYYSDISEAIIQNSGEIYQYAGDEVVVSWRIQENNDECLKCFLSIRDIIKKESEKYLSQYELIPGFKAGFHYGQVTTGEIGVIKKEIIFTGDVLNTTARIQGMCKNFNVDNLFSEDLKLLINKTSIYVFKEIGECKLRGRDAKVKLYCFKNSSN